MFQNQEHGLALSRFSQDASASSFLSRSRTRLRCYADVAPRWCHRLAESCQHSSNNNQVSSGIQLPSNEEPWRAVFNPGLPSLPFLHLRDITSQLFPASKRGFPSFLKINGLGSLVTMGFYTKKWSCMTWMIWVSPITEEPDGLQDLLWTLNDSNGLRGPMLNAGTRKVPGHERANWLLSFKQRCPGPKQQFGWKRRLKKCHKSICTPKSCMRSPHVCVHKYTISTDIRSNMMDRAKLLWCNTSFAGCIVAAPETSHGLSWQHWSWLCGVEIVGVGTPATSATWRSIPVASSKNLMIFG